MRKNSGKKKEIKTQNETKQNKSIIKKWKLTIPSIEKYKRKIENLFGSKYDEFSFDKLVNYMYKPTDAASLGICRALFGKLIKQ